MAKQSIWVLLFIIGRMKISIIRRMKISIINRKRTPTAICGNSIKCDDYYLEENCVPKDMSNEMSYTMKNLLVIKKMNE